MSNLTARQLAEAQKEVARLRSLSANLEARNEGLWKAYQECRKNEIKFYSASLWQRVKIAIRGTL